MPSHYNPDEFSRLHKTLSKSFAMQRKTLIRVLGLEDRVSNLEGSKLEGEEESSVDRSEFIQWHDDSHKIKTGAGVIAVSYTHLTLPTIYSV